MLSWYLEMVPILLFSLFLRWHSARASNRCVHAWYLLASCCPSWENVAPYLASDPPCSFRRKGSVRHLTMDTLNASLYNRWSGVLFHRPIFEFKLNSTFHPIWPHLDSFRQGETYSSQFMATNFATLVRFFRFFSQSFWNICQGKGGLKGTPIIFYCTIDLTREFYISSDKKVCFSCILY